VFKLNLKIAFRSLVKNRVYTLINIGGLAIGLTAFVLLLLYINHENSYDKWDSRLKNVYQVRELNILGAQDNNPHWQEQSDTRVAGLLKKNIPQFKAVTKVGRPRVEKYVMKTGDAGNLSLTGILNADSLFFKVFPYHFLYGNSENALSIPNSIVLKQSTALKIFGGDKVVGKTIKLLKSKLDPGVAYTITGIVSDPSTPEHLSFMGIIHNEKRLEEPEQLTSGNSCEIYVLSIPPIDTVSLNKTMNTVYRKSSGSLFSMRSTKLSGLKVVRLADVHGDPSYGAAWKDRIKPVLALSVFLLLVSVINFINLSTAQSVQRAKEVGVKKVLGTYRKQLVWQFLFEAALQCLVAVLICVVLVELLLPAFGNYFDVSLSFLNSKQLLVVLLELAAVFIIVSILAGLYPAWILSTYNPIAVLKGNYEHSFKGVALRNGLIVVQFIIAVTFIIGIGVMQFQTRYLNERDLGFDRAHLININSYWDANFAERIKKIPGISYVGTTTQVLGNTYNDFIKVKYRDRDVELNSVLVTPETLPALGVKLLNGRMFSKDNAQDSVNTVVLNESAAKLLGKDLIGAQYDATMLYGGTYTFKIVGIIKDYNNEGFDKAILPTAYKANYLGGLALADNLLVRFNTQNYKGIIDKIQEEWTKMYPDWDMTYTSGEAAFQKQLLASQRLMDMIILFSAISVLLSLLGLFALSAFVSKRRTKEIAIRKVLGASDFQLINMLNRSFLILVITANLISWPIAYIITNKWLQGFAYRVDMPVMPFITATVVSVIIAVLTVSLQARKAALGNPVKALKYE
jgi:putative ABC transport system permease protein